MCGSAAVLPIVAFFPAEELTRRAPNLHLRRLIYARLLLAYLEAHGGGKGDCTKVPISAISMAIPLSPAQPSEVPANAFDTVRTVQGINICQCWPPSRRFCNESTPPLLFSWHLFQTAMQMPLPAPGEEQLERIDGPAPSSTNHVTGPSCGRI